MNYIVVVAAIIILVTLIFVSYKVFYNPDFSIYYASDTQKATPSAKIKESFIDEVFNLKRHGKN